MLSSDCELKQETKMDRYIAKLFVAAMLKCLIYLALACGALFLGGFMMKFGFDAAVYMVGGSHVC